MLSKHKKDAETANNILMLTVLGKPLSKGVIKTTYSKKTQISKKNVVSKKLLFLFSECKGIICLCSFFAQYSTKKSVSD